MTDFRIVSGGQTGVDRAALDAALLCGIPCSGWCPAGRLADDGPIADSYPLSETAGSDYTERTEANVRDSDATLILGFTNTTIDTSRKSAGTTFTVETAHNYSRPLFFAQLVVGAPEAGRIKEITGWISDYQISVLNIAGPRESECPGIYAAAYSLVRTLILEIESE